jgi:hypothetical protein
LSSASERSNAGRPERLQQALEVGRGGAHGGQRGRELPLGGPQLVEQRRGVAGEAVEAAQRGLGALLERRQRPERRGELAVGGRRLRERRARVGDQSAQLLAALCERVEDDAGVADERLNGAAL